MPVEIVDFLRGRWIAVLIGAPIVAALLAGGAVAGLTKPGYRATGTVAVAQALPSTISPTELGLFVDDFRSAVKSTGLSTSVATGTDLQATAPGDTIPGAVSELKSGVRQGLVTIANTEREQAQVDMTSAKAQLDAAVGNLNQLEKTAAVRDVTTEYRNRSQDVLTLRNQIAQAQTPALAADLSALLAQKTAELERFGAVLTQYQQLDAQVTAANEQYETTSTTFALAEARLRQVTNAPLISAPTLAKVGRLQSATKTSAAAGLVAFAAVVAAAVITRRSHGKSTVDAPEMAVPSPVSTVKTPSPVASVVTSLPVANGPTPVSPLRITVNERRASGRSSPGWRHTGTDQR